jgi:GMP synthase-like glutamine amidotransferase
MSTGHNSFEDIAWMNTLVDFTAKILKQNRIRTIGVCFGHQIVGRAMGVKVGRNDDGWEAAVNDIDLSERGKQLFGKEKLVMPPIAVAQDVERLFII